MDYRKAYENALKRAKEILENPNMGFADDVIVSIFPELAENEDEQIRKEIIDFLGLPHPQFVGKRDHEKWIAWLEKRKQPNSIYDTRVQYHTIKDGIHAHAETYSFNIASELFQQLTKEQQELWRKEIERAVISGGEVGVELAKDPRYKENLEVKVEPKFRNGQWIVWQDKCYKVNCNGCGYELVDENGLSTSLEYGTIDENAHLWDITKDAKEGDVLANKHGSVFIYAGFEDDKRVTVDNYCYITANHHEFLIENHKTGSWYYVKDLNPATKEQRDVLFQKMKEAGYTFDFKKKELKKIEQKPVDNMFSVEQAKMLDKHIDNMNKPVEWNNEDERMLNILIKIFEVNYSDSFYKADTEGTKYIKASEIINWLKSFENKCIFQLKKWSEEDEKVRNRLIKILEDGRDNITLNRIGINTCIDWLKSIKDRCIPQPKEWSEEDESMRIRTLGALSKCLLNEVPKEVTEEINWLKSLRPQNRWKPDEKYLESLEFAISVISNVFGSTKNKLRELLEQLKAL